MPPATAGIAKAIGHKFKDNALLVAALTHPSALNRNSRSKTGVPFERMEFLGDRVVNLAVAGWLYELYPNAAEGDLAKRIAELVKRDTLAAVAAKLGLLEALVLAPGTLESHSGHATVLGDAMEAVFGAIYLDAGFIAAEKVVRTLLADIVARQTAKHAEAPRDPKTALQEWAQSQGLGLPVYTVTEKTGPSHAPQFTVAVTIAKHAPISATGTSKQEAGKAAAALLLSQLMDKK